MDDSLLMCRLQRLAICFAIPSDSSTGIGPRLIRSASVSPPDEFHDQELPVAGFFESVYRCDVGMIQRRQNARFTLESCRTFAVVSEGFGKELDCNTAAQLRVGSLIDLSHAARSQMAGDFVMCELGSDHDAMKMCGRILSNTVQGLTHLKLGVGTAGGGSQLPYLVG